MLPSNVFAYIYLITSSKQYVFKRKSRALGPCEIRKT